MTGTLRFISRRPINIAPKLHTLKNNWTPGFQSISGEWTMQVKRKEKGMPTFTVEHKCDEAIVCLM